MVGLCAIFHTVDDRLMPTNVVEMLSFSVDSSSEEEVRQPTKLSQFLNAPSPPPKQNDHNSSRSAQKEHKSGHVDGDKHHNRDRQATHSERQSDRDYASTQQKLLALADYGDQPSHDRDNRDSSGHKHHHHKSSHHSKLKNSRSPGHHRRH